MLARREAVRGDAVVVSVLRLPDGAAPACKIGRGHPELAAVVILLRRRDAGVEPAAEHQVVLREVGGLTGQQAGLHGAEGGERPTGAPRSLVLDRGELAHGAQIVAGRVSEIGTRRRGDAAFEQRMRRRPRAEPVPAGAAQRGVETAPCLPEYELGIQRRSPALGSGGLSAALGLRRRRSKQENQKQSEDEGEQPRYPQVRFDAVAHGPLQSGRPTLVGTPLPQPVSCWPHERNPTACSGRLDRDMAGHAARTTSPRSSAHSLPRL